MDNWKGTKGNWEIKSKSKRHQFYYITGKDDSAKEDRDLCVCCIDFGHHPIKSQLDRTEANAKLITAAPDLLDALQDLVRFCEENHVGAELQLSKEAIEKALK